MDAPRVARRPMAWARQIGLFRREIRESVSPAALELVLARAAKISEGELANDGRFYGCTMLTIDLARTRDRIRESCDAVAAAKLAQLLRAEHAALTAFTRRVALEEAQRLAGRPLRLREVEVRLRSEGAKVFIDVDIEAESRSAPLRARPGSVGR